MNARLLPIADEQIERHICYIDFSKAFDTIHVDSLCEILEKEFDIPATSKFSKLLQYMFQNTLYAIKGFTTISQLFNHIIGTMQGLPISPILFICYINSLFLLIRKFDNGFPLIQHQSQPKPSTLNSQGFADDTNLVALSRLNAKLKMTSLIEWCYFRNMTIN
jgi:hypothetical protein